jgi:hypothetical protein
MKSLPALLDAVQSAVAALRDVDLSERCNTCEGLDSNAVHRVADDLEHAARRAAAVREEMGREIHEDELEIAYNHGVMQSRRAEWRHTDGLRAVERRVRGL